QDMPRAGTLAPLVLASGERVRIGPPAIVTDTDPDARAVLLREGSATGLVRPLHRAPLPECFALHESPVILPVLLRPPRLRNNLALVLLGRAVLQSGRILSPNPEPRGDQDEGSRLGPDLAGRLRTDDGEASTAGDGRQP